MRPPSQRLPPETFLPYEKNNGDFLPLPAASNPLSPYFSRGLSAHKNYTYKGHNCTTPFPDYKSCAHTASMRASPYGQNVRDNHRACHISAPPESVPGALSVPTSTSTLRHYRHRLPSQSPDFLPASPARHKSNRSAEECDE